MTNPKISIIIPIYNTGKLLYECIDSCLNQSFRDIEIILVNDASTDSSLNICEVYAKKDKRVVLINKTKNEGVDAARFLGMSQARGKYLMFVDSDDRLTNSEVLSIMHEKLETLKVDYVEIGMNKVIGSKGWIKKKCISSIVGLINQPELFDKYYISFFGMNILFVNMAGKLYRKSVIDSANVKETGLKMGEDLAFNMQLFPYLKSVYILETTGYNYIYGGITSHYNPYLLSNLKALHLLKEKCIEKYNYNKAIDYVHVELKNILRSDICQAIIYRLGTKEEILERIKQELRDPVYERIVKPYDHIDFYNSAFMKALAKKDVELMYSICQERVLKERPKRMLKKIASLLM